MVVTIRWMTWIGVLLLCMAAASARATQPLRVLGGIGDVDRAAFTSDGKLLLATNYLIAECDVSTGAFIRYHAPYRSRTLAMACLPHDTRVVSATFDGEIRVWDRVNNAVRSIGRWLPPDTTARYLGKSWENPKVTISSDGSLVAIVSGADPAIASARLVVYDSATFTPIESPEPHDYFAGVAPVFSADSAKVYTAYAPTLAPPYGKGLVVEEWNVLTDSAQIVSEAIRPFFLGSMAMGEDGLRYGLGSHDLYECSNYCPAPIPGTSIKTYWSTWMATPSQAVVLPEEGTSSREYYCSVFQDGCHTRQNYFLGTPTHLSPRGGFIFRGATVQNTLNGEATYSSRGLEFAFSPDERHVATWDWGGVSTLDASVGSCQSGEEISSIQLMLPLQIESAVAALRRGDLMLGHGYKVSRLELGSGSIASEALVPIRCTTQLVSPAEDFLAASGDGEVIVGSADGFTSSTVLQTPDYSRLAAINPVNGNLLLISKNWTTDKAGLLEYLIDSRDFGKSILRLRYSEERQPSSYTYATYTPNGHHLIASTDTASPELQIFRTSDGSLTRRVSVPSASWVFGIDRAGRLLIRLNEDGKAEIYRLQPFERLAVADTSDNRVNLKLIPDTDLFLTMGPEDIEIRRTATGESVWRILTFLIDGTVAAFTSAGNEHLYIVNGRIIQEYDFPLAAIMQENLASHRNLLLDQSPSEVPADRNGDGVLDAADLLMARAASGLAAQEPAITGVAY